MKILFLKTKYLCYESNTAFIDEMIKAFRRQNVEVEICEVMNEEEAPALLEQLCGRHFDACIDFNAVTPRAVFDDGTPFLDTVDAPFFNYIVDHPFYHHPILRIPLKNYHVLCLDRKHVSYIEQYYPHIKSAHFLPLGAMKAMVEIPFEKKKTDLLFTGTYYMTDDVYMKQIKTHPIHEQEDMKAIIDVMLANPKLTMEDCLQYVLTDTGREVNNEEFAKLMNRYHQAEFYVRAHNRHQLVDTILGAGIPLTIIGNKWEYYKSPYQHYLTLKESVSYALSIEMILHAKMLVNILPNFKDGIHDRVLSAMCNQSVSITDTSTYLEERFQDGENIVFYELDKMDKLPERIIQLQNDSATMEKIAQNGRQRVLQDFTWDRRVEEFLKIISNLK